MADQRGLVLVELLVVIAVTAFVRTDGPARPHKFGLGLCVETTTWQ